MEYYIEKFKLSSNYDKKELKEKFRRKINEVKNSNLSSIDKELYLNYLSEIYDNLKNNIFETNIINNNFDTFPFSKIINKNFDDNNLVFSKSYKIIMDNNDSMPIINYKKPCNDKVHKKVINMNRKLNNPIFDHLIKF